MSYSPYAPPEAPLPTYQYGGVFRPLGWKTTATAVAIGASSVLSVATTALTGVVGAPTAENLLAVLVMGLVGLVLLCVALAASVLFLVWMHQAATNVRSFGHVGLRFEPAWCVLWWFIPIASLWKPYQALAEIWRASDPQAIGTGRSDAWRLRTVPSAFPLWWSVYVAASFIALAGGIGQALANAHHADALMANVIAGIGQVVNIGAAVAIIWIMRRLDENQRVSAERATPG